MNAEDVARKALDGLVHKVNETLDGEGDYDEKARKIGDYAEKFRDVVASAPTDLAADQPGDETGEPQADQYGGYSQVYCLSLRYSCLNQGKSPAYCDQVYWNCIYGSDEVPPIGE